MTSYHFSGNEHDIAAADAPSVDTGASGQEKLTSLPAQTSNENKTIIVQMAAKPKTLNTTKLKSLLPKNLLSLFPKSDTSLTSMQLGESQIQSGNNLSSFPHTELVVTQPNTVKPHDQTHTPAVSVNVSETTSDALESFLQQIQNSLISVNVVNAEDNRTHSYLEQEQEKSIPLTPEAIHSSEKQISDFVPQSITNGRPSVEDNQNLVIPSSHQLSEEQDKEQDVIKKTMVEAFVKMVVCRKVTVQKVHAKTGQILDTKVKTEEEEPVILGVDCVETTEDLISSGADSANESSNTDLASSKWGASLDGGLKFLSAVSESRQKIGKNVMKDKLLRSSSQKGAAKVSGIEHDTTESTSDSSHRYAVETSVGKTPVDVKMENESDIEWNEELNDDSEDYVPGVCKTRSSRAGTSAKNLSSNTGKSIVPQYPLNVEQAKVKEEPLDISGNSNMNSSPMILFPRKRGRKRKWDNALGMAANLRICQFCNKHFSNVQACAKHMKKGKCVSSVFCLICSKPFRNEQELEGHLLTHGNEAKSGVFECKDCNRAYRTRAGYVKHFRMGTCLKRNEFEDGYTGDFECDLCESRFSTMDYLKLHRYKVHENPKDTHNCPDCGKRFYSTQGYNKHRGGRPCTEPLRCRICGKTYSSKAKESFKIHMKHHRSEVTGITFQCDECGRSYMTQMALTKHKLSHTGVKPYKCEICGKEFSMRYMVKDHARMHTGERPYLCSLCGSAFSNKGHLGRHLRSHENGTLLKRGRPKKIKEPEENNAQETELKMIDLGQTLQNLDGQTIQVVDGHLFESQSSGTPMIIQASNNTIIIAEGWPNTNVGSAIALPCSQENANVTANFISSNAQ